MGLNIARRRQGRPSVSAAVRLHDGVSPSTSSGMLIASITACFLLWTSIVLASIRARERSMVL